MSSLSSLAHPLATAQVIAGIRPEEESEIRSAMESECLVLFKRKENSFDVLSRGKAFLYADSTPYRELLADRWETSLLLQIQSKRYIIALVVRETDDFIADSAAADGLLSWCEDGCIVELLEVTREGANAWLLARGAAPLPNLAPCPVALQGEDKPILVCGEPLRTAKGESHILAPPLYQAVAALVKDCTARGPGFTREDLNAVSGLRDTRKELQDLAALCPEWGRVFPPASRGRANHPGRYVLRQPV